jgi:hypothetical protein
MAILTTWNYIPVSWQKLLRRLCLAVVFAPAKLLDVEFSMMLSLSSVEIDS